MASLLTVDEVQARVATSLEPLLLAQLIDDVEAELEAAAGPANSAITETLVGGGRSLFLKRPISSITSIAEWAGISSTALTASDYTVWHDEGRVERAGPNWAARVVVVYAPRDDSAKRRQVIIDLIQFYIARSPLKQENVVGEYAFTAPENWEAEKARLIQRLRFTSL